MTTPQWPSTEPGGQPSRPWAPPDAAPAHPEPASAVPDERYAPPSTLPAGSAPADWNPYAAPSPSPGAVPAGWDPYAPPAAAQPGPWAQPGQPPWPPQPGPPPGAPAPPHKWGFGAFFLAEAVFLLTSIVVPLVAVLPYGREQGEPLPGPVLVAALSIPPIVAAVVAILATVVRGNGPVADLKLAFGWRDVGIGVACGVGGIALTIPAGALWARWAGDDANSAVGEIFDGLRMPVALAVVVFLQIWLVAPLCEEILFRGLLWGAMEKREWNRWLVFGITTVAFSLAHFELQRAPLLLVIAIPIGLARLLSGRLAAPVIAHQINNFLPAIALTALLLGYSFE